MTDHDDNGWLEDAAVPTFFQSVAVECVVVVFLRAGTFDEPLALTGVTELALRAALAGLPTGHAVRESRIDGQLSSIVLAGDADEVSETLRALAELLGEPDEARIAGELRRARSGVTEQHRGPRELHLGKRFGSRGPGTSDLPRYGPYRASTEDVAHRARRAFTAGNAALVLLAEDPFELSFELPAGGGDPPASAPALDAIVLPARGSGPPGGVSASVELPCTLAGRLAFALLLGRLEATGTPGDLSATVEQIAAGELIGLLAAPVADAYLEQAGAAIVGEAAALARRPPELEELRAAIGAWLAEIGDTPYSFGRFVVAESLLGSRHASREELVDRLWELEPADVALAAELMSATLLLLLPPGVAIDELRALPAPAPRPRVRGRRHRAVGAAIDWAAWGRGVLIVGDEGLSHVVRHGPVVTMLFDDVEVVVDYQVGGSEKNRLRNLDDGVLVLVGSASWLQVDPRLWRRGERVRSTILEHVAAEHVVAVPKGERAVVAGTQAIERQQRLARRRVRRALTIFAGTIAFVVARAVWAGSREVGSRQAGCARVGGDGATRMDCSGDGARYRVLATTEQGAKPCPRPTDAIVATKGSFLEELCLRSRRAPHAGDPGGGGGILVAGDCIADPTNGTADPETRCGSAADWATVAAITTGRARCPRAALDVVTRATFAPERFLCLSGGPAVIERGDCVTDPQIAGLEEVRCGLPEAAYRVTDRVASRGRCPEGAEDALVQRALPRAAVACLRRA
jgi:hypothetical protein